MNIINKILILVIVVFLINHLTEGRIIETIQSYFNMCKDKVEEFIGLTYTNKKHIIPNHPDIPYEIQRDFGYINKNDETYKLYNFIKNLINVNINFSELTPSQETRIPADKVLINDIMNQLVKILNCHGFRFNNIKLLEKIFYYENHIGKEIEVFNISTDVLYRGKSLGSIVINFKTYMKKDIFFPKEFVNGLLTIANVKIIDHKYPSKITKETIIENPYINGPKGYDESTTKQHKEIKNPMKQSQPQKKAIQKAQEMTTKMTESFNNHFVKRKEYDDLFIKSTHSNINEGFMNDTDNSLIPTIVELSSITETSN